MSHVDDLRRALDRALTRAPTVVDAPSANLAAVSAIFDRDLRLLFIRRADRDGDPWSGHVGFPGGRAEDHDPDALGTAIRETHEEVGLRLDRRHALGQLDDVAPVSGLPTLIVRPFVFLVDELPEVTPNAEVASTHPVPLPDLLAGRGRGAFDFTWRPSGREPQRMTLPRVDFDDGPRLWGLTLRMVDDLLHRIDGRGIGLARLRGETS